MDNVFVIVMIFTFFAIPRQLQHRVLFWGILGVIVLRAIMIGPGAALVSQFSWVLYLFGAFLVLTGLKMLWMADHQPDLESNVLLESLRRVMRVTPQLRDNAFFVREPHPVTGQPAAWATPPAVVSLTVTAPLIGGGVLVSLWKTRGQPVVESLGTVRHGEK